jgi:hypothetical protein
LTFSVRVQSFDVHLHSEERVVQSRASTVKQYLDELSPERRKVVSAIRELVLKSLPKGYHETMGFGMISYGVPLERYPNTYNGQPLCYAAVAAQKNHYALYLMGAYANSRVEEELRRGFADAGKKLDKGQSCIRFKSLDDLPLDVVSRAVAAMPPEELMALHEGAHRRKSTASKGATAKGATAKGATAKGAAAKGATKKGATKKGATKKGATKRGAKGKG